MSPPPTIDYCHNKYHHGYRSSTAGVEYPCHMDYELYTLYSAATVCLTFPPHTMYLQYVLVQSESITIRLYMAMW